jgi:hypothetical protein
MFIKELLAGKYQMKIERLRMHEKESLDAYKKLYGFISHAEDRLFPPDDPRCDFIEVMKNSYAKEVKPNMLFFTHEIRDILFKFESQYEALSAPDDIYPEISFDDFINNHVYKYLESLRRVIEKKTDEILH